MKEINVKALFAFVTDVIDVEAIPLDDQKTYNLLARADTDGVYMDYRDPNSIIRRLSIKDVRPLIDDGIISGGMIPKVENAVDALQSGVNSVHILDGRVEHSLLLELFTDAGCGTMIKDTLPSYG